MRSGRLYLGATNRVYQLDERLSTVEAVFVLGPHLDSPSCPPPPSAGCHDASSLTQTDAFVKALAIDRRADRLIICTNLFQGHCDRLLLGNVSLADPPVWSMVVPNDHRFELSSLTDSLGLC
jgi:Sema domain